MTESAYEKSDDKNEPIEKYFREGIESRLNFSIQRWLFDNISASGYRLYDIARRVGVHKATVSRWTSGMTISLGHLGMLAAIFNSALNKYRIDYRSGLELKDYFPTGRELVVSGYISALTFVKGRSISREEFWCLYFAAMDPKWLLAAHHGNIREVESAAKGLFEQVALPENLGNLPVGITNSEAIMSLLAEWLPSWFRVIECIDVEIE